MSVMDDNAAASANPPAEDYAGRRDLGDLKQAYRASGQEAVRQKERADRAEQLLQQFAANQRQDIPQRGVDPFAQITEYGVPGDVLRQAVQQEAGRIVQETFTPIVNQLQGQAQARNHMLASYGKDFTQFEQDVAQFIQSDTALMQRYNTMFAADPVAAVEYGFLKFTEDRRRQHPETANGQDTRQQQAQAAIPSQGGGNAARNPNAQFDAINAAWEAYQANPSRANAEHFAKLRLRSQTSDKFLGLE